MNDITKLIISLAGITAIVILAVFGCIDGPTAMAIVALILSSYGVIKIVQNGGSKNGKNS